MRQDIIVDRTGREVSIDITKAIGTGYGNGWFTNCGCRYRFFKGARNTKKSKDIMGYEPVIKIISDERRNVLICRQNDVDNRQSCFENILGCIYDLGMEDYFHVTKMPLEITYKPTGQKIIFRGLNNPTSLNSITFAHGYLTDVYIEEAYEVQNYDDFRKLDGSLRSKLPPGLKLQITCCFNAWNADTWINQEFFKGRLDDDFEYLTTHRFQDYKDDDFIGPYGTGLYLHISTYKINEFRDKEVYDRSMEEMRVKDLERYKVEALGMWGNSTMAVYPEFNDSCQVDVQNTLERRYMEFSIGIDTGLSDGTGRKISVTKKDDPNAKVRSATAVTLVGITEGYKDIVIIDEYFHSNDRNFNSVNTDNRDNMTQPQLAAKIAQVLIEWQKKYGDYENRPRGSILMRGTMNVYIDSADVGFRQVLEMEARKAGIYNANFYGSGKKSSIQSRVDLERTMMAYGNFLVSKQCPNTIREFRNAVRGDRGEARADGDDHCLTSLEYATCAYWNEIISRKNFKEH